VKLLIQHLGFKRRYTYIGWLGDDERLSVWSYDGRMQYLAIWDKGTKGSVDQYYSIVLTLLGRSGGAEAGLVGRRTLQESFDLELRQGGERRLKS
jgi:hypothetical protein